MIDGYVKYGDDKKFKAIVVDENEERKCVGEKIAYSVAGAKYACRTWCKLVHTQR